MEGSVSQPVESVKRESDGPDENLDGLEVAMKELFEAKTDSERASAFRAAFDLLEQEPHEEYESEPQ